MVLVVDDSPFIRAFVAAALARIDVATCEAESVMAARAICHDLTLEAVVVDFELPDEPGVALCYEMQRSSNVPVVLMSGHSEDEVRSQFPLHQQPYFLAKPFTLHQIQGLIRQIIGVAC